MSSMLPPRHLGTESYTWFQINSTTRHVGADKADKGKAMVSYGKADYTSAKEGMPSWWGMPTWWKHADLPGVKVGMRGATRNGKQRSGHQVSCICFMNRLCRVSGIQGIFFNIAHLLLLPVDGFSWERQARRREREKEGGIKERGRETVKFTPKPTNSVIG